MEKSPRGIWLCDQLSCSLTVTHVTAVCRGQGGKGAMSWGFRRGRDEGKGQGGSKWGRGVDLGVQKEAKVALHQKLLKQLIIIWIPDISVYLFFG